MSEDQRLDLTIQQVKLLTNIRQLNCKSNSLQIHMTVFSLSGVYT